MLNVERGKGKGTRMAREGNRKDSTWLNSLATLEKENHSRQKFLRISNNPEWIAICGSRVSQLVKTFLHLGFSPKMRPFLLSFFLSLSLFPSSSFFPSSPRWFDRSRGMQRAIYNASVFGSISEENYHRSLWESPFTVSSLLPFSSSLRYIYFPPWETSKASPFSTNLSRLFSFFVRTFRAFSTKCQIVTGRILRLRGRGFTCILVGRLDRFSEGTITLKDCLQGWNDQWNTSTRRRINQQIAIIIFDRLHFPYFPRNSLLSWLLIQEFTSDSWSIR